jgi:hypothetical protein
MAAHNHHHQHGQATIEYVITLGGLVIPLTFAIIFTAELLWVWHSAVDFTRDGARYAATHCWQPGGENVASYMRTNVPLMVDMDQFRGGQAEIAVDYFRRNTETGQLEAFSCDGGECSTDCIPDTVTVRIRNYEFRRFFSYLGLSPVRMPEFQTALPMEGAGCDPEQGSCLP